MFILDWNCVLQEIVATSTSTTNNDGPYPFLDNVPESLSKNIITTLGNLFFVDIVSVFPVSYWDTDLVVFDFELLGTRICARKVGWSFDTYSRSYTHSHIVGTPVCNPPIRSGTQLTLEYYRIHRCTPFRPHLDQLCNCGSGDSTYTNDRLFPVISPLFLAGVCVRAREWVPLSGVGRMCVCACMHHVNLSRPGPRLDWEQSSSSITQYISLYRVVVLSRCVRLFSRFFSLGLSFAFLLLSDFGTGPFLGAMMYSFFHDADLWRRRVRYRIENLTTTTNCILDEYI